MGFFWLKNRGFKRTTKSTYGKTGGGFFPEEGDDVTIRGKLLTSWWKRRLVTSSNLGRLDPLLRLQAPNFRPRFGRECVETLDPPFFQGPASSIISVAGKHRHKGARPHNGLWANSFGPPPVGLGFNQVGRPYTPGSPTPFAFTPFGVFWVLWLNFSPLRVWGSWPSRVVLEPYHFFKFLFAWFPFSFLLVFFDFLRGIGLIGGATTKGMFVAKATTFSVCWIVLLPNGYPPQVGALGEGTLGGLSSLKWQKIRD